MIYSRSKLRLFVSFTFVALVAFIGSWLWSVCIRWKFVGAARDGNIRTVRAMLDNGMEPDIVSHIGGIRAISMAAYSGHADIVRLLLDRGANPTYGLPQAILSKRVDILRVLIARGADMRHWRGYQGSPLRFAQEHGNVKIIALLKSAGAK